MPYRLAIPQYLDRRVGIEPTMFHNLAGIEPDGQLPHSTTLVYLRIFKAHKSVALPAKQYPEMVEIVGIEPTIHSCVICCLCLYLSYIYIISYFFEKINWRFTRHI